MDELANQGYSVMPATIKAELTVLEKGKLLIRHPHFNQYIFVRFPRPPILTSQDGINKFKPVPERSFEDAMIANFKRLDKNIRATDVKDAIIGVGQDEVILGITTKLKEKEKKSLLNISTGYLRKNPPEILLKKIFLRLLEALMFTKIYLVMLKNYENCPFS